MSNPNWSAKDGFRPGLTEYKFRLLHVLGSDIEAAETADVPGYLFESGDLMEFLLSIRLLRQPQPGKLLEKAQEEVR